MGILHRLGIQRAELADKTAGALGVYDVHLSTLVSQIEELKYR